MSETLAIYVPYEGLTEFCRQYKVRELSVFGSALKEDSDPDSDIDLLVSFAPDARVTFTKLARMRRELEALFGRRVDLVPKDGLKPVIRDHVLASARTLYAA